MGELDCCEGEGNLSLPWCEHSCLSGALKQVIELVRDGCVRQCRELTAHPVLRRHLETLALELESHRE